MSTLSIQALSLPPLGHVDLELSAGIHVVVGRPEDGTESLVAAAAGMARPRRGRVCVDRDDPYSTPAVRCRLGCVLRHERLPPGTLRAALELAQRARNQTPDAAGVVEGFGMAGWLDHPVSEPIRAGAAPWLSRSHSPFASLCSSPSMSRSRTWAKLGRDRILRCLSAAAERGAVVLCTTSSLRDALELSEAPRILHQGRLAGAATLHGAGEWMPGLPVELVVQTPEPRRFAASIAGEAAVSGSTWNDARWPGEIRVQTFDVDRAALAVMRSACEHGLLLSGLSLSLPPVTALQAAGAGWAKAAYDAAYARAAMYAYAAPATAPPVPQPSQAPAVPEPGQPPAPAEQPAPPPLPPVKFSSPTSEEKDK